MHTLDKNPDLLCSVGFKEHEDHPYAENHWSWFEKPFESVDSQVKFVIQIEFDIVFSGYHKDYFFNRVNLIVINRNMDRHDSSSYDEDTAKPRRIDNYELCVHSLNELSTICIALGDKPWPLEFFQSAKAD